MNLAYLNMIGAADAWIGHAELVEKDLTWLLRLPCHKFWSQIQFDDNLQVEILTV